MLIGAYQDDTGAVNAGAAYLFSTNGGLLTINGNIISDGAVTQNGAGAVTICSDWLNVFGAEAITLPRLRGAV